MTSLATLYIIVGSHLSEHTGTKGCSDNWNVRLSETILFVYKEEYFPFNAQQISMNIIILGVQISEDSDN